MPKKRKQAPEGDADAEDNVPQDAVVKQEAAGSTVNETAAEKEEEEDDEEAAVKQSSPDDPFHNEGEWARWMGTHWSTPVLPRREGSIESYYREHFGLIKGKGPRDSDDELICTTYDPTQGRPCGMRMLRDKEGRNMLAHLQTRHVWLVARNDRDTLLPSVASHILPAVQPAVKPKIAPSKAVAAAADSSTNGTDGSSIGKSNRSAKDAGTGASASTTTSAASASATSDRLPAPGRAPAASSSSSSSFSSSATSSSSSTGGLQGVDTLHSKFLSLTQQLTQLASNAHSAPSSVPSGPFTNSSVQPMIQPAQQVHFIQQMQLHQQLQQQQQQHQAFQMPHHQQQQLHQHHHHSALQVSGFGGAPQHLHSSMGIAQGISSLLGGASSGPAANGSM